MNSVTKDLDTDRADEYARWFRCLADGTRVRILSVVAGSGRALTVGEIVDAIGKSQSTVSRHLQILAEERFVHCEADGIRTLVRANPACMVGLPRAAAEIMGTTEPGAIEMRPADERDNPTNEQRRTREVKEQ